MQLECWVIYWCLFGQLSCAGEVVVDLFAGIGYFVLPYLGKNLIVAENIKKKPFFAEISAMWLGALFRYESYFFIRNFLKFQLA